MDLLELPNLELGLSGIGVPILELALVSDNLDSSREVVLEVESSLELGLEVLENELGVVLTYPVWPLKESDP